MNIKKRCSACSIEKQLENFGINRQGAFGRRSVCNDCRKVQSAAWYAENKTARNLKAKEWYRANKDRHIQMTRTYDLANPGRGRIENLTPEQILKNRERGRKHHQENAATRKALKLAREDSERQLTPNWANRASMNKIYKKCAVASSETGVAHHVDHQVPLTPPRVQSLTLGNPIPRRLFFGPLIPVVQGLHCEANLAVCVGSENIKKSNRIWPDMPTLLMDPMP